MSATDATKISNWIAGKVCFQDAAKPIATAEMGAIPLLPDRLGMSAIGIARYAPLHDGLV
jgi:hypothetical protein